MICDSLSDDEIYQAYSLYASLHGLDTSEEAVRQRVSSYLRNVPDETIDDAILAFTEDSIVAPPDVVLSRWGKSRVYELHALPTGGWRHQVCESWFENGCAFDDARPVHLAHFWTQIELANDHLAANVHRGMRCQFKLKASGQIEVHHRRLGSIGLLPSALAEEIAHRAQLGSRYLGLIDVPLHGPLPTTCKLLIILASEQVATADVVEYAAQAFTAARNKC